MTRLFSSMGMKYSLAGKMGNTLDAHRLVAWVQREQGWEKADRLMQEVRSEE